jgi:hypothetical protein
MGSLGDARPIVRSESTTAYIYYSLSTVSRNMKSIPATGKKQITTNIGRPIFSRRSLFHAAQVRRVKMTRGAKKLV